MSARALAIASGVLLMAAGDAAAQAPDPARIAFSSAGRIQVVSADGSGRVTLTGSRARVESEPGDTGPSWSPDGKTLAFTRAFRDERAQIFTIGANGGVARPLTRPGRALDYGPAWSPDGSRIALTHIRRGVYSIQVVNRDGSGRRTLATERGTRRLESIGAPKWSPDGRRIMFSRSAIDRRYYFRPELHVMNADGSGRRVLARDAELGAWSPDGSRIAYSDVRDRNGTTCGSDECEYNPELYVMDADSTDRRRLTRNKVSDVGAAWSPDGTRIAFSSDRNLPGGGGHELYSIRPDGSCLTWLTNGTASNTGPDWEPGGGGAAPRGCGATPRAPLIELNRSLRRPWKPVFWLGRRFGPLLLSHVSIGNSVRLQYGDCSRFDPRRCPPALYLGQDRVCSSRASMGALLHQSSSLSAARGALLGLWQGTVQLHSGQTEIGIGSDADLHRPRLRRLARNFVRELRPLGSERRTRPRLAGPWVPRPILRRVRRTADAVRRGGSVREVARALGVSRRDVRSRLRMDRALRRTAGVRPVSCGRR